MTNTRSTKRALLTSIMAMVLCVAMLAGTTFAWFTDSVTSSNNIIKSGTLDVTFEYWDADAEKWVDVKGSSEIFDANALWEPGYTEVIYLKVANNGSLALKYQLGVNVVSEKTSVNADGELITLSDYIYFDVVEGDDVNPEVEANRFTRETAADVKNTTTKISAGYLKSSELVKNGDAQYVALVVYMPETVGNEANYDATKATAPEINLGLNVIATQYTVEEDSFGKDYDENAWAEGMVVCTAADLQAALAAGGKVTLGADIELTETVEVSASNTATTYSLRSAPATTVLDLNGKTIKGTVGRDADNNRIHVLVNNGNLVITNGTIESAGVNGGSAIVNNGTLTVENVTLKGAPQEGSGIWPSYTVNNYGIMTISDSTVVGAQGVIATNVATAETTVNNVIATRNGWGGSGHVFYTPAGKLTVNGGTYTNNANGVDGMIFASGSGVTTYVNGGTFDINDGAYFALSNGTNIVITDGDFSDIKSVLAWGGTMTVSGGIFGFDPTAYMAEELKATKVDNAYYVTAADTEVATTETVSDVLKNAESGDVVQLAKGEYTLPSMKDNQGVTIIGSEGTVVGGENVSSGFGYSNFGTDTTIKNITFSGTSNGVRYSYANGGSTTFENCTFEGESTYGFHIDQSNGATFTFNNCTFIGFNAFAGDLEKVVFNNCTFLNNGNYGHTNIWSVGYFNNCTWGDNTSVSPAGSGKLYFNDVEESYHHEFIGSAESLVAFAKSVNEGKDSWKGQAVLLVADIDLQNEAWTPIGQTGATEFKGIFDGQGYTISNLYVNSSAETGANYSSGLFGWTEDHGEGIVIKNVNVDGATIIGNHNTAVIMGYTYGADIINCHVSSATVACNHANDDACGDKAGIIGGYVADESKIINCSATNCFVNAGRDAGQLIGAGYNVSVSECSATDVTVSATAGCTDDNAGKNLNEAIIGRVLG